MRLNETVSNVSNIITCRLQ